MTDQPYMRKIKSFVKREGRLTQSQARAMDILFPKYGITPDENVFDFQTLFGNDHPVVLEIGFGMGQSLVQMAQNAPETNFIGIEVHTPGIGMILNDIETHELSNLRVIQADAVEVLNHNIPNGSLSRVNIFFPDPWHKARHHKRRLIQPEFVSLLAQKIATGGMLHLATDWENYAEHMMEVLSSSPDFTNPNGEGKTAPDVMDRPETKFERRGLKLGHGVWDLVFKR